MCGPIQCGIWINIELKRCQHFHWFKKQNQNCDWKATFFNLYSRFFILNSKIDQIYSNFKVIAPGGWTTQSSICTVVSDWVIVSKAVYYVFSRICCQRTYVSGRSSLLCSNLIWYSVYFCFNTCYVYVLLHTAKILNVEIRGPPRICYSYRWLISLPKYHDVVTCKWNLWHFKPALPAPVLSWSRKARSTLYQNLTSPQTSIQCLTVLGFQLD